MYLEVFRFNLSFLEISESLLSIVGRYGSHWRQSEESILLLGAKSTKYCVWPFLTWSVTLLHFSSDGFLDDLRPLLDLSITVSCQWVEHLLIVCQDVESMGLVADILQRERERLGLTRDCPEPVLFGFGLVCGTSMTKCIDDMNGMGWFSAEEGRKKSRRERKMKRKKTRDRRKKVLRDAHSFDFSTSVQCNPSLQVGTFLILWTLLH